MLFPNFPALHATPSPDWLEIIQLDRSDWRISDARLGSPDGDRLVGYIERLARDRYELLWMTDPLRWAYVDSFDAARTAFADSVRFTGMILSERDAF